MSTLYSSAHSIPHLVTVRSADVVVLVIDVIEEHDRVAPFDVHRQAFVVLQVDLGRLLDLGWSLPSLMVFS